LLVLRQCGFDVAGVGDRFAVAPTPCAGSAGAAGAALRNWALNLNGALDGKGIYVGYVAVGAWIVGTPGTPEDASPMEPDDIAHVHWNLHTTRNPAERLITRRPDDGTRSHLGATSNRPPGLCRPRTPSARPRGRNGQAGGAIPAGWRRYRICQPSALRAGAKRPQEVQESRAPRFSAP
jgi:hypothetical protein